MVAFDAVLLRRGRRRHPGLEEINFVGHRSLIDRLLAADRLLFLCSPAASAITGITLFADAGHLSAGITGSFPGATPIVTHLMGAQRRRVRAACFQISRCGSVRGSRSVSA